MDEAPADIEVIRDVLVWRQGYPSSCFLDEELRERMTCSICTEVCYKAVRTQSCEHIACLRCTRLWQKRLRTIGRPITCPQCRAEDIGGELQHDDVINSVIADADVCCLFFTETGCEWNNTLGVNGSHLAQHIVDVHGPGAVQHVDEELPFFFAALVESTLYSHGEIGLEDVNALLIDRMVELMRIRQPEPNEVGQHDAQFDSFRDSFMHLRVTQPMVGHMLDNIVIPAIRQSNIGEPGVVAVRSMMDDLDFRPALAVMQTQLPSIHRVITRGGREGTTAVRVWMAQIWVDLMRDLILHTGLANMAVFQRWVYSAMRWQESLKRAPEDADSVEAILTEIRVAARQFLDEFQPLQELMNEARASEFYVTREGNMFFDRRHWPDWDIEFAYEHLALNRIVDFGEKYWIKWRAAIGAGVWLLELPDPMIGHVLQCCVMTTQGIEHNRPFRFDLNTIFASFYLLVPLRGQRKRFFDSLVAVARRSFVKVIEEISPQVITMMGLAWPIISKQLDPNYNVFPDGVSREGMQSSCNQALLWLQTRVESNEDTVEAMVDINMIQAAAAVPLPDDEQV